MLTPEPEDFDSLLAHVRSLRDAGEKGAVAMRLDGTSLYAPSLSEAGMQDQVVAAWELAEFDGLSRAARRGKLVGRYAGRIQDLYLWAREAAKDRAAGIRSEPSADVWPPES